MEKKILDVTCGARSIWFNKHHPAAVYCDKRREQYHHLWKNAGNCTLDINPDVVCDFTNLPFPDNSFPLVVFDPPHLTGAWKNNISCQMVGCKNCKHFNGTVYFEANIKKGIAMWARKELKDMEALKDGKGD